MKTILFPLLLSGLLAGVDASATCVFYQGLQIKYRDSVSAPDGFWMTPATFHHSNCIGQCTWTPSGQTGWTVNSNSPTTIAARTLAYFCPSNPATLTFSLQEYENVSKSLDVLCNLSAIPIRAPNGVNAYQIKSCQIYRNSVGGQYQISGSTDGNANSTIAISAQ